MEKSNYQAAYQSNQIRYGSGKIAIVTGWTSKESVAKALDVSEYAVIGNLYSPTRGLDYLIRNLIANPQIRYIVTLNHTSQDKNAGGCQCLLDFFNRGFREGSSNSGRACWVVNSDFPGYIDLEIPRAVLGKLRMLAFCREATSIEDLVAQVKSIIKAEVDLPPWGKPQTFPKLDFTPVTLPGIIYGHRIEGKTIAETWLKIIHRIKTTGIVRTTSHDAFWQELIDLVAVVTDEPEGFYFPDSLDFPCDRNFLLNEYIPQFLYDQPSDAGIKYTYGQRLRSHFGCDQIQQVVTKLAADIDSASAVMNLWDTSDHLAGGSPCLNHIWVRVVDSKLSLTAVFRSNDMFSAWMSNAFALRALQLHIIAEISNISTHNLIPGPLITLSQSAHIYSDCYEHADIVIDRHYSRLMQQEFTHFSDRVGSFVIEVKNGEIVVQRITPGSGEVVKVYQGKDPKLLSTQIVRDAPAIAPQHCFYLGIELQKASFAIIKGKEYCQDRKT